MKNQTLPQRYAEAFADVVERAGRLEPVRAQLTALSQVAASSKLFQAVVQSGRFSRNGKRQLVLKLAEQLELDGLLLRFLLYLTARKRLELLDEIADQFSREADRRLKIQRVEVTSAVELSDEQCEKLERRLRQLSGKRIRMVRKTDASLLGGLQIRMGNTFFDGSLKGRLQRIQERISHGPDATYTA